MYGVTVRIHDPIFPQTLRRRLTGIYTDPYLTSLEVKGFKRRVLSSLLDLRVRSFHLRGLRTSIQVPLGLWTFIQGVSPFLMDDVSPH